jgi:GTP 3',8-cyclase
MANLFLDGHKLLYHLETVERWLSGEDIAPIHVEISPTSLCNQRCKFCYRDFDGHKYSMIKREVFLALMKSVAKAGVKSCLLAGDGEPLVNKATPEAILTGRRWGVDMALNTNGVLLTPEIAGKILPSLTWLRFSVMSTDPKHYAFIHGVPAHNLKVALDNIGECARIKREKKLSVTIGIQQVLLNENAMDVYAAAKTAKEMGVDYYVLKPFSKHPLNDYDSATDLHVKFKKELERAQALSDKKFSSIIRWNTFSDEGEREYDTCLGVPFIAQIGADGGFYSCCPFFGDKRFLFGNVNDEPFEKILRSKKRKEVLRRVFTEVNVHKDCMAYCRHHQINKFLWQLTHEPKHVNFI